MIRFVKEHWKTILVILIILIFPIIVNFIFTIEQPIDYLVAKFTAGDLLAYGALVISIYYGFHIFKKEHRNSVKPIFSIKLLSVENTYNMAYDLINRNPKNEIDSPKESVYKEFFAREFFVIIDNKGLSFQNRLSDNDQEIIRKKGLEWKVNGDTKKLQLVDYISVPLIIENLGNGPAINCRIGVNRRNDTKKFMEPKSFKKNEDFYLHIYSRDLNKTMIGPYLIEIEYNDIYGTGYNQFYEFEIQNDEDNRYYLAINPIGKSNKTRRNRNLIGA